MGRAPRGTRCGCCGCSPAPQLQGIVEALLVHRRRHVFGLQGAETGWFVPCPLGLCRADGFVPYWPGFVSHWMSFASCRPSLHHAGWFCITLARFAQHRLGLHHARDRFVLCQGWFCTIPDGFALCWMFFAPYQMGLHCARGGFCTMPDVFALCQMGLHHARDGFVPFHMGLHRAGCFCPIPDEFALCQGCFGTMPNGFAPCWMFLPHTKTDLHHARGCFAPRQLVLHRAGWVCTVVDGFAWQQPELFRVPAPHSPPARTPSGAGARPGCPRG